MFQSLQTPVRFQADLPAPPADLGLVVVIPCFDEPDILTPLQSLAACTPARAAVEVYVVINASPAHALEVHQRNRERLQDLQRWWAEQAGQVPFQLYALHAPDLPRKHAGVGLARRLGMDLAAARLLALGRPEGLIVNLDADCHVAPNYFQALESHFERHATPGASLAFEHPLSGDLESSLYAGIVYYELFLRYYVQALRYAGLPWAFHTIGSAMAVRAGIYRQQGGMNRRKAGEDFYFLQKIIELGGFSEINQTRVYPSPRRSLRVLFGTGKAMVDWLQLVEAESAKGEMPIYRHYALQSFRDLRQMLQGVSALYPLSEMALEAWLQGLSEPLRLWLEAEGVRDKVAEIADNAASAMSFDKRFFHWFNAFRAMKAVHALRDTAYPDQPLEHEALALLQEWSDLGLDIGGSNIEGSNIQGPTPALALLHHYRRLDGLIPLSLPS